MCPANWPGCCEITTSLAGGRTNSGPCRTAGTVCTKSLSPKAPIPPALPGTPRMCGSREYAMANHEHVALVRRGTQAIAAWCAEHPHERLDLEAADLTGIHLPGAN